MTLHLCVKYSNCINFESQKKAGKGQEGGNSHAGAPIKSIMAVDDN